MRNHIERLKQEHPAVRSRFALLCAATVTAVIALVWITTLPVRFGNAISKAGGTNNTANAISAFSETVAPGLSQIQNALSQGGTPTSNPGVEITQTPGDMSASSANADANTQTQGNTAPTTYLPAGEESSSGAGVDSSGTAGY